MKGTYLAGALFLATAAGALFVVFSPLNLLGKLDGDFKSFGSPLAIESSNEIDTLPRAVVELEASSTCSQLAIEQGGNGGKDSDRDGLPDKVEAQFRTSPYRSDTDNDGYSDCEEVIDKQFARGQGVFLFNPLIADMPYVDIEIVSKPVIEVLWDDSSVTTVSNATETSTGKSESLATSRGGSKSTSLETAISTEATVTTEVSASPTDFGVSASASVSLGYSETRGSERTVDWGREAREENSSAHSLVESQEESSGMSASEGVIILSARVRNTGKIAATVERVVLSAYMVDPGTGEITPIASLLPESDISVTLAPGEQTGILVFRADGISVAKTKQLLRDSRGLIIAPSTLEMLDRKREPYVHRITDIQTTSARVIIDYGEGAERANQPVVEDYRVAISHLPDGGASAAEVLSDILMIDFDEAPLRWCSKEDDSNGLCAPEQQFGAMLTNVRGIQSSYELAGRWVVSHTHRSGSGTTFSTDIWDTSKGEEVSLAQINLRQESILHLIYVTDSDRDGIGNRTERLYGTSPYLTDSDFDELSDLIEIRGYYETRRSLQIELQRQENNQSLHLVRTNPLLKDTDNDGLSDYEEYLRFSTDQGAESRDGIIAILYNKCDFTEPAAAYWAYPIEDAGLNANPFTLPRLDVKWGYEDASNDYFERYPAALESIKTKTAVALFPENYANPLSFTVAFPSNFSAKILDGYEFVRRENNYRSVYERPLDPTLPALSQGDINCDTPAGTFDATRYPGLSGPFDDDSVLNAVIYHAVRPVSGTRETE